MPVDTARFVTLEGGEGAGKSSALACLAETLQSQGHAVVVTREPGGTPLAEAIRDLLLSPRAEPVAPLTELMLLFAARAQHWQQVILPALAQGAFVLCDRFLDATYAYQVAGRGLPAATVDALADLTLGAARPALTVLLDVEPSVGLARAQARVPEGAATDRFESEQLAFFQRVRAGYLAQAAADPQRVVVVDAGQPQTHVQSQLQALVETWMATRC